MISTIYGQLVECHRQELLAAARDYRSARHARSTRRPRSRRSWSYPGSRRSTSRDNSKIGEDW